MAASCPGTWSSTVCTFPRLATAADGGIADHDLAFGEGRPDHVGDGLRSRGGEQERFSPRIQLAGVRIEQELTDLLTRRGSTGFARDQDVEAEGPQVCLGHRDLGAL